MLECVAGRGFPAQQHDLEFGRGRDWERDDGVDVRRRRARFRRMSPQLPVGQANLTQSLKPSVLAMVVIGLRTAPEARNTSRPALVLCDLMYSPS
jgi:hypothetical protein